jgi:phosphatidate cytidylyltransferase
LKNVVQRTVSGIIYLVVIIGSLFLGQFTFAVLFLIISLLALYEYYGMAVVSGGTPFTIQGLIAGALIFAISFLVTSGVVPREMLGLILVIPVLLFLTALYSKGDDIIRNIAVTFLGLVYIILPMSVMIILAFPDATGHVYTHRVVLGIFALVWINDTGAYLTGMTLGRHRLFSRISPKKSWEGAIGGGVLTVATSMWMVALMDILTRTDWIVLAVIVSIFGVYGDLTESLFKRSVDMKDSGSVMPGHGGILDRMDSVLFVMPVAVGYLLLRNI